MEESRHRRESESRVRVFSGNTLHGVFNALLPQFERESGERVEVVYDPAQIVLKRVSAGETGDLAILGESVLDELIRREKIDGTTRKVIASCGVGVGVRAGSAKPDISTVEKLKRVLLEARSIAYTTSGASGIHFAKVIEQLGIADEVKKKAVTQPGGLVGELVVQGKAEIVIQQIPELMAVRGLEVAAPLPGDAQNMTTSAAGVFIGSRKAAAARALIDFLKTPAAAQVFRDKGLEPA